ncbi:MAG: anthrone oxygenase family protein [Haliscomenobacter sp.]|uniref:anthrone oxygenase family protein n=1 Tax=Haliscomenobacter sp. TaxID=2717303 RepID=UPI0029AAB662|nr:anthrone oxygenase family protein [Haliscomenobacter sp.]MDX2069550.1 anthrone oxygenase family protein [Haliscomenobacter sp.]
MNLLKITEIAALLCTGLLAGVFFAFETAINPGLQRLPDLTYLSTMQQINRVIQNPVFLFVFMAPLFLTPFATWQQWGKFPLAYTWLLATVLYVVAVFGVTIFFNVPLNELLDKVDLSKTAEVDLQSLRKHYEMPWSRWHSLRTGAAVLAFLLLIFALMTEKANITASQ